MIKHKKNFQTKNKENSIVRLNKIILRSSLGFACIYFILLGVTANAVIHTKSISSHINDSKNKVAELEFNYLGMSDMNAIASLDDSNFSEPKNVIYVQTDGVDLAKNVAFQTSKKN